MSSEEIKKKAIAAVVSVFALQGNQLNEFITTQNVQVIKLLQLLRKRKKAQNRKKSQKGWTKTMTQHKKYSKKHKSWCDADEDFLVELWAYKMEDLLGPRKNEYVYQEMSESFAAVDAFYTPAEIQIKLHNLSNRYRKEKLVVGPLGDSASEWRLYQRINSILGNTETEATDTLMVDGTPVVKMENILPSTPPPLCGESSPEPSTAPDDVPSASSAAKRRKVSFNTEIKATDDMIKSQLQAMHETDDKLLKLEEERNCILRDFVNSCDKFHTDLLDILKK